MTNRKTGEIKLNGYVRLLQGKLTENGSRKRISINTLKRVSGLSEKSIQMYISWNKWGKIRNNSLILNYSIQSGLELNAA